MKQIYITTLLLSVALLNLSKLEYSDLSPPAHFPDSDPAMAMASSAITFNTLT
jgi:hypothetical protein